jgi:hypothetical protein
MRPPGLSTRAISASTAALSVERLMTQFEITTSTESAGSGTVGRHGKRRLRVAPTNLLAHLVQQQAP